MSVNSQDVRYVVQALLLGVVLSWLAVSWLRDTRPRIMALLFATYWTIAVSILYLWQGDQQSTFYSTDQVEMFSNIERLFRDGVTFSIESLLGQRYMVSIPAFAMTYVGIEPLLAYKFIQALCALVLVIVVHSWTKSYGYVTPTWVYGLVIGPSILLNSILALRDTVLAAGVATLFLQRSVTLRALALMVLFGLRPQLGVVCTVGVISGKFLSLRSRPVLLACFGLASFGVGAQLFQLGNLIILSNSPDVAPFMSQAGIARLLASLVGLQILTVDPDTVSLGLHLLIPLRLLFFDTWLIPIGFLLALLLSNSAVKAHWRLGGSLFVALTTYFGVASQTDMTSSRQTLPFYATAGLVAWVLLMQPKVEERHAITRPMRPSGQRKVPVLHHLRAES